MANNTIFTKCNICSQRVLTHNKALKCRLCDSVYHIQCVPIFKDEFNAINLSLTPWYCTLCSGHVLPCNHFTDDGDFISALHDIFADEPLNLDCL